jgi:hypothetical protein
MVDANKAEISEVSKPEIPTVGYFMNVDVYPNDEKTVVFEAMYFESPEHFKSGNLKTRSFVVKREEAEKIARQITGILAAPDSKTAWDNIAAADAARHTIP